MRPAEDRTRTASLEQRVRPSSRFVISRNGFWKRNAFGVANSCLDLISLGKPRLCAPRSVARCRFKRRVNASTRHRVYRRRRNKIARLVKVDRTRLRGTRSSQTRIRSSKSSSSARSRGRIGRGVGVVAYSELMTAILERTMGNNQQVEPGHYCHDILSRSRCLLHGHGGLTCDRHPSQCIPHSRFLDRTSTGWSSRNR